MANETKIIDLSATRKQRFLVQGVDDTERYLELNTSDLSTVTRLQEAYPQLQALDEKVHGIAQKEYDSEIEQVDGLGKDLKEVDTEMRKLVDYIFDTNVSEICAPYGSMYDPFDGKMRWEIIVENLTSLYDSKLSNEMGKIKARAKLHTQKYTGNNTRGKGKGKK